MIEHLNREVIVLNAALEVGPGERAAYLDQACAGDPVLRGDVEALLNSLEQAEDFLEKPPRGIAIQAAATVDISFEKPGDRIGRYKLLQQIGEGGCGVVYLADQEAPVRRTVAIKVIKLGMDTKQVIARFEAERQALALMDHPNIARVLDAGATETGRLYFVMELVRGIKITEFCDENNLSTEERLRLFTQVCQAIQHAHQKGVIHRDIKPSNILVTTNDGPASAGCPKVIDFGIAKATAGRLTDQTLFTAFEQFIGTPAYMSPEQAEMTSLDIDTRSDIYSLGVLLYELLTGHTPFDAKELLAAGLDEMRRTIREQEPPRPSTRLSALASEALTKIAKHRHADAPKLIHRLRGDLDWIVMNCLEKDRTRRYETANGLAADVNRHLNNEPVNARPPSAAYRFERLVRRNRLVFAALSGAVAALLFGLGGVLWQWRRAEQHAQGELKHRLAAEESAVVTRLNRYAADISVTAHAVERGDYGLARRTLEALRPQAGEPDLRGFEWRYLWSHCQGDQLATLTGHSWIVTSAAFSRDGRLFATGSQDATTRVWDPRRRELITTLRSTNEAIWSIGFSPDGELLMTAGSKGGTKFWNTTTWNVATNFPGQIAVLSKMGSVVAIAESSPFWWEAAGNVTLWDFRTGKQLRRFERPGRSLALSSDDKILAVAGKATGIELWDVTSGAVRQTLATEKPIWSLNFSPDGKRLAGAGWSSEVWVWDLAGDLQPKTLKGHQLTVWSAIFSPDGSIIATTGSDQTVRFWDAITFQQKSILRGHGGEVWCAAFSPNAELLVTGGKDQNVMLWSAKPDAPRESLPNHRDSRPIFSSDGKQVIVAVPSGEASRFELWDTQRRALVAELPEGFPNGFSSDGTRIVLLSLGQDALKQWSSTDGTEGVVPLANVQLSNRPFHRFGFSPGGETHFAIDRDGQVLLWEAATGKFGGSFQGPTPPIRNAVLGRDGKSMAISVERDTVVRFYVGPTFREIRLEGHHDFVSGLSFSPDGTLLASGSVDGSIRLWSTTNCKPRGVLFGHMQEATDVAFSSDGRTLASVGFGESVRLWHIPTCRELISINFPRAGKFLEFSHDGTYLAVTTSDNAIERFDAPRVTAKNQVTPAPRPDQ